VTAGPGPAALTAAVAAAALLALVGTEGCRRLALRHGITDRPGGYKQHRQPTPYLGGLALAAGTLAPAAALVLLAGAPPGLGARLLVAAIAALVVAAIGLADDVEPLGPLVRLAVESGAALLVVLAGVRLEPTGVPWLDGAATIGWIVLLTNAFNLLDNMDAAAASVAAVTAAALGLGALAAGAAAAAAPLLCLAGACGGFLWHNRPPARIFMGDAGSLFLGFALAVGAVLGAPPEPLAAGAALALTAFAPLLDTTLVVLSRRRAGRPWYVGGSDHTAHRLRRLGLSPGRVVGVLTGGAGAAAALGALVAHGVVGPATGLAVWAAAGAGALGLLLRLPADPAPDAAPRSAALVNHRRP
jgi:UDP-GlcNAc:undecaprenyl-phosphate GlcNAc-1-phosphate transferase